MEALGLAGAVSIDVHEAIPEHVGLGSGTQLALAVCSALVRLFGLDSDLRELAQITERGARSGVGLGAFECGGFIVDGGRSASQALPPVICQTPFPEGWRILLVLDRSCQGLNGSEEAAAFQRLPPMDGGVSGSLCRLLLMQVLPALVERDFDRFSDGLTAIQDQIGDFFAPFQGGRYSSSRVAEVLGWSKQQGIRGLGQSSWGPTGFAIIESSAQAEGLLRTARRRWAGPLEFILCGGRNSGAEIVVQKKAA
jgi:beta-RFAP synthase